MKRLIQIVALSCFSFSQGVAQDITNQTQYFINSYSLNPAYAGAEGRPAAFLSYRRQWMNINGGPAIGNLSINGILKGRLNYGVNFNSDSRGIVRTSSALASLGYSLPVGAMTLVRFGASVGVGFNGVDMSQLGSFTDKILPAILNRNAFLMGNAGVAIQRKRFQGGIVLPNLFAPVYVSTDAFSVSAVSPFQNAIFHVSNRFYFDEDNNLFEPYLMYRLNGPGIPAQWELAGVLHLRHIVWIGASYRQNFGASGLAGIKWKDQFAFGFSYSFSTSAGTMLSSPSYELQLGYLIGQKKGDQMTYSFVSSEREAAKYERKSLRQLETEKKKKTEELVLREENMREALRTAAQQSQTRRTEVPKLNEDQASVILKTDSSSDATRVGAADQIASFPSNPLEEHGLPPAIHDNYERHEVVKRGNHNEELPAANYVIAGSFSQRQNASRYADQLKGFSFDAGFGFLTDHGKWYVFIYSSDDLKAAMTQRDINRRLKIFKSAWLLTVTE